jgi:hypothetical protein
MELVTYIITISTATTAKTAKIQHFILVLVSPPYANYLPLFLFKQ